MSDLRGPADADGFRVKVGRYGDRWYCDPLPGDHIAPADAPNEVYPAVSIVKRASGSDWTYVGLKRVNHAIEHIAQYRRLDLMPYEHRGEALVAINKLGLQLAGQRGTNVHLMAENNLRGRRAILAPDVPGTEYRDAVDQFFDQYQPTLVAAEFVCIHRTLNGIGYGGTADVIAEIDGKRYLIDWKSRGVDSDHGAYPEEAAQIAGYAGADYIIVEGRDGPERRLMPELDGGLIVSIKPDGCRVYPVDLDKAFTHWSALHAWWVARRDEREAVGRQWPARKNVEPKVSPQATQSPAAVTAGEVRSADPTPSPAPSRTLLETNPDQGVDRTMGFDAEWEVMKAEFDNLPALARKWRAELVGQAQRRNVAFHVQQARTERTYWINKAVITLGHTEPDDEILRALLAHVLNDIAFDPTIEPGHLLGSIGAAGAKQLYTVVERYCAVSV